MSNNRTRGQERQDELDVSPAALAAQIEQLMGELDTARKEVEGFKAALQRERAEFLNFRRRTGEEREAMLEIGRAHV